MANLRYRLEFLKNEDEPSNESVYIQMRQSPLFSDWFDRVRKQDYEGGTSVLGDSLFSQDGITELSIQPFRVWLSKSPVYDWDEMMPEILWRIYLNLGLDGEEAISGSPVYLDEVKNRLEP